MQKQRLVPLFETPHRLIPQKIGLSSHNVLDYLSQFHRPGIEQHPLLCLMHWNMPRTVCRSRDMQKPELRLISLSVFRMQCVRSRLGQSWLCATFFFQWLYHFCPWNDRSSFRVLSCIESFKFSIFWSLTSLLLLSMIFPKSSTLGCMKKDFLILNLNPLFFRIGSTFSKLIACVKYSSKIQQRRRRSIVR